MTALICTITNAGRAALLDRAGGGTRAVRIVKAGLSAAAIAVAPTLTALPGEFKRIATLSGMSIDATTVHLTVRDNSADAFTVRAIGLYLEDGTLFAVYGQAAPIVDKVPASTFYVALDLKMLAGQAQLVQFGDANFLNPPASETVKGVAYLATIAEALAGAVADKLITPATMRSVLDNYVLAAKLGTPNGVATLGPDGKLLVSQRPPIDLIDVFAVSSEAQMLALVATPGDFAVRADNGLIYVLQATPAATLGNWLEISTPAPVSSVNGKVGTVVLGAADVGAAPAGRKITGDGLLAGQGGDLTADRVFQLLAASAGEALAGIDAGKVITPAALSGILAVLASKAPAGVQIGGSGLVTGGGQLNADRLLSVAIASAADIFAGVANDRAVTPAGLATLPQSLTPNGFISLPGGFTIQWVQVRQVFVSEVQISISFPMAFQSIVLPIVAMGYNAAYSNVRDLYPQRNGEATLAGCTIQLQSDDGRDMRLDGFDLLVMGK